MTTNPGRMLGYTEPPPGDAPFPVPVHWERLRATGPQGERLAGVAYRCQIGHVWATGLLKRVDGGWEMSAKTEAVDVPVAAGCTAFAISMAAGQKMAERIALAAFRSMCRSILRRQRQAAANEGAEGAQKGQ